jgi:hypothetical protein
MKNDIAYDNGTRKFALQGMVTVIRATSKGEANDGRRPVPFEPGDYILTFSSGQQMIVSAFMFGEIAEPIGE